MCGESLRSSSALDGDLDRVVRCVRIAGFVNSMPDFHGHLQVVNGASDTVVAIFGEAGRHTRLAVGAAALPYDVAVEVEGVLEVRSAGRSQLHPEGDRNPEC